MVRYCKVLHQNTEFWLVKTASIFIRNNGGGGFLHRVRKVKETMSNALPFFVSAFITQSSKYIFSILAITTHTFVTLWADTGVLISPYPDQEGNKVMFLSEWSEFLSAPCLAGKKYMMTARVLMLLKSRVSLTCFWACLLPGRAKDLSAPR